MMEIFYHQMCKIDKIEARKMLIKTYKGTLGTKIRTNVGGRKKLELLNFLVN